MRVPSDRLLIAGLVLGALALRFWGSLSNLPYVFHADEPNSMRVSFAMLSSGDLNPHFFQYPSLFFYLNTAAYAVCFLIGHLTGSYQHLTDIAPPITIVMGTSFAPSPELFVIGRLLSIAFGAATVGVVYLIGRRLAPDSWLGVIAAALTAVSQTLADNSRSIAPDAGVMFFVVLALFASVRVWQDGRLRDYILAGAAIGAAAGTKYNGAIVVVAFVSAHLIRRGARGAIDRRLWLTLALAAATFALTTPYAIFDFPDFLAGVRFESDHYSTGHFGMEGNSLRWYASFLWRTEGLVVVLASVQLLRGLRRRAHDIHVIAAVPVVYVPFISLYAVRNDRIIMLALPFIYLLAAALIASLIRAISERLGPGRGRVAWRAAAAIAIVWLCVSPLSAAVESAKLSAEVDTRIAAAGWLNDTLPAGSRIAFESYSPFLDGHRFALYPSERLIERTPEWFTSTQIDYVIVSREEYGRFYREPQKYAAQVGLYDDLFRRFTFMREFSDERTVVRLYQVSSRRPR